MSNEDKSKKDLFVKGLNWGSYSLSENKISFQSDSKDWFQIPFNSLSNVQQGTNKNEITLEFNKDDDNNDSAICELRLFVPELDEKQKEKKKQKEDNEKNEKNEKIDGEGDQNDKEEE
jgi:hypothetical protein